jgi:hypothetical protein
MPSTVIKSYEYLPEKKSLIITFVSGKKYEYFKVPEERFEEFKAAFSKGIYFNQYIKPFHSFRELKTLHF